MYFYDCENKVVDVLWYIIGKINTQILSIIIELCFLTSVNISLYGLIIVFLL